MDFNNAIDPGESYTVTSAIPITDSAASGLTANMLAAAGTTAAQVGNSALNSAGVVYDGLHTLGEGAILAGLILGAIVAFIIDKRFWNAAIFAGSGAVLSFIGLIHGPKVEWNSDGPVALGYLFLAVICVLFALTKPAPREPEPGELYTDVLVERY